MTTPPPKKKMPKKIPPGAKGDSVVIGKDGSMEVERKAGIPVRRPPPEVEKRLKKQQAERAEREEQLKADRLKTAQRYESMKLYQDAIKYYKMAEAEDEAERVKDLMSGKYLNKAREFEAQKKYDEALHLYDILGMEEDVNRLKSMVDTKVLIDDTDEDDEEEMEEGAMNAFRSMNKEGHVELQPMEDGGDRPVKVPKGDDDNKAFSICPYCGETLNLPKKPKFCPYCREPF